MQLAMIGYDDGAEADFLGRITQRGFRDRVHLIGPQHGQTKWEALRDASCGLSMAETAERLAERYDIGRESVDCYAARSQACAKAGWRAKSCRWTKRFP